MRLRRTWQKMRNVIVVGFILLAGLVWFLIEVAIPVVVQVRRERSVVPAGASTVPAKVKPGAQYTRFSAKLQPKGSFWADQLSLMPVDNLPGWSNARAEMGESIDQS